MKIREGFVSNSSSSNFVLKGYLLDDLNIKTAIQYIKEKYPDVYTRVAKYTEPIDEEFVYTANQELPIVIERGDCENGIPEGEWFVGKELQNTGEDCYLENEIIDFQPSNDLEMLKDAFDIKSDIKVIVGTRGC